MDIPKALPMQTTFCSLCNQSHGELKWKKGRRNLYGDDVLLAQLLYPRAVAGYCCAASYRHLERQLEKLKKALADKSANKFTKTPKDPYELKLTIDKLIPKCTFMKDWWKDNLSQRDYILALQGYKRIHKNSPVTDIKVNGELAIKIVRNQIKPSRLRGQLTSLRQLEKIDHVKKKQNQSARKEDKVYHLGAWPDAWNKNLLLTATTRIGCTCCTRKDGRKRELIPHEKWKPNLHQHLFFMSNRRTWTIIDKLQKEFFPKDFDAMSRIPLPYRCLGKGYASMAVNVDFPSQPHVDQNDYGFSCVAPFGDYQGGDLIFPQLSLQLEVRPGDIVFFDSAKYVHCNAKYSGVRYSFVLFTKRQVFEKKKGVPWPCFKK